MFKKNKTLVAGIIFLVLGGALRIVHSILPNSIENSDGTLTEINFAYYGAGTIALWVGILLSVAGLAFLLSRKLRQAR